VEELWQEDIWAADEGCPESYVFRK